MEIEVKKSSKLVDYTLALRFLEKRVKDVINEKKPELLWILEHKPIFTAGTSYKENEILNKNIKVIKTTRGGKITYHGPGQLVCYFVLDLKKREQNIRKLISYSYLFVRFKGPFGALFYTLANLENSPIGKDKSACFQVFIKRKRCSF